MLMLSSSSEYEPPAAPAASGLVFFGQRKLRKGDLDLWCEDFARFFSLAVLPRREAREVGEVGTVREMQATVNTREQGAFRQNKARLKNKKYSYWQPFFQRRFVKNKLKDEKNKKML